MTVAHIVIGIVAVLVVFGGFIVLVTVGASKAKGTRR